MYEPRTILQATWPLEVMTSLAGLGNFHFGMNQLRRTFCFFYSMTCIVGYITVTKVAMTYVDQFYLTKATDTGYFTFTILLYGNILLTLCLIVTSRVRSKGIHVMIRRIGKCDQIMEAFGVPKNYRKLLRCQLVYSASLITTMSVVIVINYNWLFSVDAPVDVRVILTITVHYPIILIGMTDVPFLFWVRYARLKFQKLNEVLRAMLTTTPESPQHKRVLAMHYDFVKKTFVNDRVPATKGDADTMKAAKRIHLHLIKLARNINEMYGVQLLLTMTTSFVLITGFLYDAYTILWLDISTYEFAREIVPVLCWVLFYAFKIFFVTHECAKASKEACETGYVICELYEPSTTREFRAEIQEFTLQLLQNPLIFTACGFFSLDHTYTQELVGSITTYLVILIQVGEIPAPGELTNTTETSNDLLQSTTVVSLQRRL